MSEKIIDEVMGLISDWSEKDFLWGSSQIDAQSAMATSADFFNEKRYGEEAKSAKEAIRAKLREVLERKPLSDQKILDAWYGCGIGATYDIAPSQDDIDWCRAIERAHNIGVE